MSSQEKSNVQIGDHLQGALEAILLVIDSPITASELSTIVGASEADITFRLEAWSNELANRHSGIDLRHMSDGWRLYTRDEYADYVEKILFEGGRARLSRAALETLAVIAYQQPVTRSQVSAVRGVNVDGVIRTLLARGLIVEHGQDPDTGAKLFCTTSLFLDEIGISDLSALPDLAPLLPEIDMIDEIDNEAAIQAAQHRHKTSSPG